MSKLRALAVVAIMPLATVPTKVSAQSPSAPPPSAASAAVTSPTNVFQPTRPVGLPTPTCMHGTAVVGSRIYIFGGDSLTSGWSNEVWSAEILANGSLGSWSPQRPLPDRRSYIMNSVQVVNSRIYIVGGSVANDAKTSDELLVNVSDAIYTEVQKDGQLSPWKTSVQFPGLPRSLCATANNGRHLFVVGGATNTLPNHDILAAPINTDGTLGEWKIVAKLPAPLWFHGAAILDSRLFVWGGLTTSSPKSINREVWSAEVATDANLGPWQVETPMPQAMYSSAYCGFNDHLISIGGRYVGGNLTNDVWFTQFTAGRPGQWTKLVCDLETECYHSLGLDESKGWVFITGGHRLDSDADEAGPNNILSAVRAFQITQPPPSTTYAPDLLAKAGFVSLEKARKTASADKPILIYFRSPQVPACERFENSVIASPQFRHLAPRFTLAVVDVSKDIEASYKYSMFKVPSMALLDSYDSVLRSSTDLTTFDDVAKLGIR